MDAIKVNPFITQEELADIVGIAKKHHCKYEKVTDKRLNKAYWS